MKRVSIFGTQISVINLDAALDFVKGYDFSKPGYICFPDLSVLEKSSKDSKLNHILNNSLLSLPDGKPLEFSARLKGEKNIKTVSGYWLSQALMDTQLSHYFYGANDETCNILLQKLHEKYPKAKILGASSPPMLPLNEIPGNLTIQKDIEKINKLKPDLIWIGISSPKQDYLMDSFYTLLDHGVMMGVGGVFDYLAGSHKISPEWIKKIGLRWLYRLLQSPKRLWKKYLHAGLFLVGQIIKMFFQQVFGSKKKAIS